MFEAAQFIRLLSAGPAGRPLGRNFSCPEQSLSLLIERTPIAIPVCLRLGRLLSIVGAWQA